MEEAPFQAGTPGTLQETGITDKDLEFVAQYPEPLVYDWPAELTKPKTGRGQNQYWFLFRFMGDESAINIEAGGEASSWKWMPLDTLLDAVAPFRKRLYQRLFGYFRNLIPASTPTAKWSPAKCVNAKVIYNRLVRPQTFWPRALPQRFPITRPFI